MEFMLIFSSSERTPNQSVNSYKKQRWIFTVKQVQNIIKNIIVN